MKLKIKSNKLLLSFQITTAVLFVALIAVLLNGGSLPIAGDKDTVATNTVNFINNNFDAALTLVKSEETNGVYNVTYASQGQQGNLYVTKNGQFIFPTAIPVDQVTTAAQAQQQTQQNITKSDKPIVQLFVMSFCPYGQQAEDTMLPVVALLGNKVTVEPHFIVNVEGTTVNSLHGAYEANEDMRQACIIQEYSVAKFWEYVKVFNGNCTSSNIDTCWKEKAQLAGINVATIETCVQTDGISLMKAEQALSEQNSVSGSPTLLINGAAYSGARTPDAYKLGICSGFTTEPTECGQTVSTAATTAAGNC